MGTRNLVVAASLITVLAQGACSGRIVTGAGVPAGGTGAVDAGSSGGLDLPALATGGRASTGGNAATGGRPSLGGLPAVGGSATPQACAAVPAPSSRISSFVPWNNGSWGAQGELTGGQALYQSDATATFTATVDSTAANPSLHLTATVPSDGFAGYVMWFGPCVDASAFGGIRFQIAGSLGGATLDFQIQINDDYPIDAVNRKGACTGGTWSPTSCWNNHAAVAVTSDLTTVSYAWAELTGGYPISPVDPRQLIGLQWQADCAASATSACPVDLTLDTVEFF